ncbi:helicase C-terminal domain-containing protein [Micromonospora sp. NPDC048063]|uniref:helicase C-terminal domain-containing protein n=1 Tax=Micromonospora sp. NPDC048063 TaxID=3364256 RepID=UPI003714E3D7
MRFDFGRLSTGNAIYKITDPAALFDALPNKAGGYGYLRAVQKTVLDAWSTVRDQRDVVIKTNTGGGKTVVGLLILQCCLHEKKGPALYLAPHPHLAARVREEAARLGLAVVDDPEAVKFLSGEAICVTTMNTLVNGKTRFGLSVPGTRQPIAVGSIVIDDAHAALASTEEKTRLHIPRSHPTYNQLVDLFTEELKSQDLNGFLGIETADPSTVVPVPFWGWQDKHETVMQILHPHREDSTLKWSWPLIADILPWCQAVATAHRFEIVPLCPPIEKIPSFAEAKRRIYLTATLADDSVLVTHFDADPEGVGRSIVPESAADLGDRLVLSPQELNPDIDHEQVRALALQIANTHNVVVLVPSHEKSREWAAQANLTISMADDISAAVARLTAGHVGLVVMINQYDGIDLPDDACRLLIIDSLPFAYTGVERREATALRDSEAMVTRQLQRLEQGMGRGVRSRDDRCAVLLLGPRLTQLIARPEIAGRMSQATRAQLDLSRQVARQLEEDGDVTINAIGGVMEQVIGNDPGFRALTREVLLGATYSPASVSAWDVHLRHAYNHATQDRLGEAVTHARKAVEEAHKAGDVALAGWLGETYATYLHAVSPTGAQEALSEARKANRAVLRPRGGVAFQRIEVPSSQAQQAVDFLTKRYDNGPQLILGVTAVLDDIAWDNTRTAEAEAALAELGEHMGFTVQQPERDFNSGPDVLWSMGGHRYVVIEAKTGATAPKIWKDHINQLSGSVNWCRSNYGGDAKITPVLVHPTHVVDSAGTAPLGTRVVSRNKLKGLKAAVQKFARALAHEDRYRDPAAVEAQLADLQLAGETLLNAYAETAYREPASTM